MKQPLGTRVIIALARHERAAAELGHIKKGIVSELEKCPITVEAYDNQDLNCDFRNVSEADHKRLWDGSRVRHHLHEALQVRVENDREYGPDRKLHGYEIQAWLEGHSDEDEQLYQCPHCLAAWLLIERRKDVRHELGIAKRSLRALGKSALKAAQ